MKQSLILAMVLVGLVAGANSIETEEILKNIVKAAEDQAANGAGPSYEKYDMNTFSEAKQIQELKEYYKTSSNEYDEADRCVYDIVVGTKDNLRTLNDKSIQDDPTIVGQLEELAAAGMITSMVSAQWDGSSGDGEYCMIYDYHVFTKDGFHLNMEFNHTD